jgi:hypothetical protein
LWLSFVSFLGVVYPVVDVDPIESFYPKTTKDWNALKNASVGAPSIEAFKACLRQ